MRLNVHEFGAGAPLICLHGLTGHGRRYARLAGRLAGRRLTCPDLRGHGDSPKEPPWDVATHVADVLETVPPERADWLGFSFGGLVAATIAAAHPERVARLVLLDPSLHIPPHDALERAELARADEAYETVEEAIEGQRDPDATYETPREFFAEEVRENMERDGEGRLRWRYCKSTAVAAFGEMAKAPPPIAPVPTLMVTGDASWIPSHVARYGDAATHVELASGHSVLWDAFEEAARAVAGYLDSGAP